MIKKKVYVKDKNSIRKENIKSLLKSSAVVIALLSIIMPLFFISSKSIAAEGEKQYKYTFNMGRDINGQNYVYEIYTTEKNEVRSQADIKLDRSCYTFYNKEDSMPDLESGQTGRVCLYDYLYVCARNGEYYGEELARKSYGFIKALLFSMVEEGYAITGDRGYDSFARNGQMIDYVLKGNAGYPDNTYPAYSWGKWEGGNFGAHLYVTDLKSCLNCYSEFPSSYMKLLPPGSAEQSSGKNFKGYMRDDVNIAYIITKAKQMGLSFGFTKNEIEANGVQHQVGSFSYVIDESTLNEANATIDVKVFYTPASGGNSVSFGTYRYTKGGVATASTSDVFVTYIEGNEVNGRSNTYVGVDRWSQEKQSYNGCTEARIFPKVGGPNTGDGLSGSFYRGNGNNTSLHFSSSNYLEPFQEVEYDVENNSYNGRYYVPFAIAENDSMCISYFTRRYSQANPSICILGQEREYGHDAYPNVAVAYTACRIPYSILNSYFPEGIEAPIGRTKTKGNWTLVWDENKDWLSAYNTVTDPSEEEHLFIMNFNKDTFYKLFFTQFGVLGSGDDASLRLALLMDEDQKSTNVSPHFHSFYQTSSSYGSRFAAILTAGRKDTENLSDMSLPRTQLVDNMIQRISNTEALTVNLQFYDISANNNSKRGQNSSEIINIETNRSMNEMVETSGGDIVSFDITDWLIEKYGEEIEEARRRDIESNQRRGFAAALLTKEDLLESEEDFYKMLFRYSKPIIMFLVFIMIVWTGIYSIMVNQDAKQRALVKDKLKHILIGIIMFSAIVSILWLCKSLMDTSFSKIEEISMTEISNPLDVPDPDYDDNWAVNLVVTLINAIADIIQWLIDSIMCKVVSGETAGNLGAMIFNTGEIDFTLSPFTENEWNRYMYGYQALEALALALLAVALVKFAMELVIHAGNSEKIAEAKETCLRVAVAMLSIILGPYAVRLLLTLFNYLVMLVPLRDVNMDLVFQDPGIIGAIANLMFVWIKFKIYLVFVVRKLMITFMLLVTPVVFGLWAISNKFRSLSLWIGELVTNAATQFCYALVFFITSIIMFTDQSDFVTLILIMMFMQLADFFKDSLQGLIQQWGGINETAEAEKMAGNFKKWTKKAVNTPKQISNKVGGAVVFGANYIDPNAVTGGGRIARNIGNVMQGNLGNIESKGKTADNISKLLKSKADEDNSKLKYYDEVAKGKDSTYNGFYKSIKAGNMSLEESQRLKAMGNGEYDDLHDANVAVHDRDRHQAASDYAKSYSKENGGIIDKIKNGAQDKVLNSFRDGANDGMTQSEFKAMGEELSKNYKQGAEQLADKSGDLEALKSLKESGKAVDDETIIKSCTAVAEQCKKLDGIAGELGKDNEFKAYIQNQINDALSKLNNKEAKGVEDIRNKLDITKDQMQNSKQDSSEVKLDLTVQSQNDFSNRKNDRQKTVEASFGLKK